MNFELGRDARIMSEAGFILSETGFSGLEDLQDFAMRRKNPVGDVWNSRLDLRKTLTFRPLYARQNYAFKSCLSVSFICAQVPQVDDLRLRKSGFSSRFPKTSFPPNFNNKTTSVVVQKSHIQLPYYLIYTRIAGYGNHCHCTHRCGIAGASNNSKFKIQNFHEVDIT